MVKELGGVVNCRQVKKIWKLRSGLLDCYMRTCNFGAPNGAGSKKLSRRIWAMDRWFRKVVRGG